jgi:hypothetical protein
VEKLNFDGTGDAGQHGRTTNDLTATGTKRRNYRMVFYVAANHCSKAAPYARYYELAHNSYQECARPGGALMLDAVAINAPARKHVELL